MNDILIYKTTGAAYCISDMAPGYMYQLSTVDKTLVIGYFYKIDLDIMFDLKYKSSGFVRRNTNLSKGG